MDEKIKDALLTLAQSGDYRVLERLKPRTAFTVPKEMQSLEVKTGLIVDVETTGTDRAQDEIIELGLVAFAYQGGYIREVRHGASWFREPSKPIPEEITRITGITNDMVNGQALPVEKIEAIAKPAVIVIAHHAGFDRPFVEKLFPWAAEKHWACSMAEIDWPALGAPSRSLQAIAWHSGFFYDDGHRAHVDCQALLHVLAQGEDSACRPPLLVDLLKSAAGPTHRVAAVGAPFELKDTLKARGYGWNPVERVWFRDLRREAELEAEKAWLAEHRIVPGIKIFNARTRYSERA